MALILAKSLTTKGIASIVENAHAEHTSTEICYLEIGAFLIQQDLKFVLRLSNAIAFFVRCAFSL